MGALWDVSQNGIVWDIRNERNEGNVGLHVGVDKAGLVYGSDTLVFDIVQIVVLDTEKDTVFIGVKGLDYDDDRMEVPRKENWIRRVDTTYVPVSDIGGKNVPLAVLIQGMDIREGVFQDNMQTWLVCILDKENVAVAIVAVHVGAEMVIWTFQDIISRTSFGIGETVRKGILASVLVGMAEVSLQDTLLRISWRVSGFWTNMRLNVFLLQIQGGIYQDNVTIWHET